MVRLRPNRDRSLRRRHPWVFSGAVGDVFGAPGPGDTVVVESADGALLGLGAYSPASQIRVRMWTFAGADETDLDPATIDEAFVAARVSAAAARRDRLVVDVATGAARTDAVRLVFSEADGVPGLVADRYGDTVVVQITAAGAERFREAVADALMALPGVSRVFERSDADSRTREGLEPRVGILRGDAPPAEIVVHEDGWRFPVDVSGGHKTGFYLDQRHARRAIAGLAVGRRMLNVFAYTGAFGVVGIGSGASSLLSIDSSAPALAVARRSAALNGIDHGFDDADVLVADAFTALRGLRDRARQFDLIALDPPKLAANDRQVDKASRAYKDLNLLALKLLAPGGILLTFSCSGAMSTELFTKVVAGAALDAGRTARIVGRLTQPDDHPVPLAFPEAEYLKGLIVEVD